MRRWARVLVLPLVLALAGCGSDAPAGNDNSRGKVEAVAGLTGYPQQLAASGRVRIGVEYDAPGIGYLAAGSSTPAGFDVEIAKILAGGLGIAPSKIQWIQTLASSREQVLTSNAVDLVVASYPMTRARMAQVGMAGPYYITGAQLLVRAADQAMFSALHPGPNGNPRVRELPAALDTKVCTASGSTTESVIVHEFHESAVVKATIADCVGQLQQGVVSAVATDGLAAMGFAQASGGALVVVGDPFTEERYGVGFPKGMAGMCDFIQKTLLRADKDGSWLAAFSDTLGKSGVETPPEPPAFEPC